MTKIYIEENDSEINSKIEGSTADVLGLYAKLTYDLAKHVPKGLIESAMRVGISIKEDEENDRATNN